MIGVAELPVGAKLLSGTRSEGEGGGAAWGAGRALPFAAALPDVAGDAGVLPGKFGRRL